MKKIIAVIALAAGASLVNAEEIKQPTVQQESASLLGAQYLSAGLSYIDINHTTTDAFGANLTYNVPVTAGFDFTSYYNYVWQEGNRKNDSHELGVAATAYYTEGDLKPFGTASLSYVWPDYVGVQNNDRFFWGLTAGVEYAIASNLSVSLAGNYSDDFRSDKSDSWAGILGVNYAFTKQVVATAAVTWYEKGSVGYSIGCAYKF